MGLLSGPHLNESIEPAPVKHCLPALRPPEADGGDTAHRRKRTRKHTLFKHRKVLTPNSSLRLRSITRPTATKSQNRERRSGGGASLDGGEGNRMPSATRCLLITQIDKKQPFIKSLQQSNTISAALFFKKTSLTPSTHFYSSVSASTAAQGWGGRGG